MEKCVWSKTLLSSYKYFERIALKIDSIIENEATSSRNMSLNFVIRNGAFSVADRIIELSERKKNLINLKVLTELTLARLSDENFSIISKRFFENVKIGDIFENVSIRTAFRKIDNAVLAFDKALKIQGYNDKKLEKMMLGEKWILDIKEDILTRNLNYAKA